MIYDLNTVLDRERFKGHTNALYKERKLVECREVKPRRTSAQNRYLHVILGEFALQYGETIEYVKQEIFKRHYNADIFVTKRTDKIAGPVEILRSSTDLDTAEMTLAIERFRNGASRDAGIYLPEPHETEWLAAIEREMQYRQEWL